MSTNMRRGQSLLLGFVLLALVAVGTHFATFELRYMWYLSDGDANFLRIGYGICLVSIVALMAFYPSRFLIAGVGLATFLFPPLLRGEKFVSLDWRFAGFVLLSLLLLVGATELRRRLKPH